MDTLHPQYDGGALQNVGVLSLAHVGDAVYELMTRTALCMATAPKASALHKMTVRRVCADAQAQAAAVVWPLLDDEELAVFKRGRNAKTRQNRADAESYMLATALEALFGYLFLTGRTDRLGQLMNAIEGAMRLEK